jgi:sulfonate transport system permease protein
MSGRRGLVLPLLLLGAWELVTRYRLVNVRLLVPPSRVFATFASELRDGALLTQLGASLARDLSGATLGTLAGVLIGVLMGCSRLADRLLGSTFHGAKQVAIFAWIPLMSVWLGTGELAKVVFVALAAFYPVVLHTIEGIRAVGSEYVEVARVFRLSRLQVFRRVIGPGAAPSMLAGVQIALVYSWLATIGAEYLLAAAPGIGTLMIDGREQFRMDKVLVGVVVAGVVGAALSALAKRIGESQMRWRVTAI